MASRRSFFFSTNLSRPHHVPSFRLRLIQPFVSHIHDRRRVIPVFRKGGNAETCRKVASRLGLLQGESMLFYLFAYPFSDGKGVFPGGFRKDYDKLLAAVTRRYTRRPADPHNPSGNQI